MQLKICSTPACRTSSARAAGPRHQPGVHLSIGWTIESRHFPTRRQHFQNGGLGCAHPLDQPRMFHVEQLCTRCFLSIGYIRARVPQDVFGKAGLRSNKMFLVEQLELRCFPSNGYIQARIGGALF